MIVKSIEEKKKKKKKATVGDKTTFVGKKALSGAISGTTNIVKSPLQNVRKEITKGEAKQNSSLSNKTKDAVKALVYTLNPTLGNIANSIETGKKNRETLKDKDKNALEKTVQILGRSFTSESNRNKVGLNKTFETLGELGTGDKLSKSVKNAEDFISKPSKKIQERLAKEGQNYDKTTQAVGNVFETVGNMAPSIVASGVTKNPTLSTTLMSTSAKAAATEEAENKGKNIEEAVNIGNLKGTAEALTEKISGGAKIFGKGSIDDIAENAINKSIKNKGLNFAAKQGLGIAGEVGEEELSNVLSNIVDKGYGEKDKKIFNKQEAKDTALQTIGSTALLNLLTGGYGGNAYNNNVNQLNQYNKGQEIQKQVKSGKLTPEQGIQALEQVKNGTYEQNNNIKQIAQEQVQMVQEQVKNGQITPDEASRQINAITQTVQQQNDAINNQQNNDITKQNSLLNQQEQTELNGLEDLVGSGVLSEQELQQVSDRINYLNKKANGDITIKHNELVDKQEFDSFKREYNKYKNLDDFNNTQLNKAKEIIQGNKQGRRTKQQWLDVAENIGSQIENMTPQEIEKYALQSWHDTKPNTKDKLNRQGNKYVGFGVDEWVKAVYKGAEVGKIIENNINESYNNVNEGVDYYGKRGSRESNQNIEFDNRGRNGTLQEHSRIQEISRSYDKRSITKEKTVTEQLGTKETRQQELNNAKNNIINNLEKNKQKIINDFEKLGIKLNAYNNDVNSNEGYTDTNGDLYVGNNDYSKANFEQKAYHELFHHIIRNKSLDINNEFKSILNDYKSNPNELTSNVNNYLTSKNYNESLNEQGAKIFAEELLADYSAKHLANYNIDYQLNPEIEYRLNTALDDAITELKLKQKERTSDSSFFIQNKSNEILRKVSNNEISVEEGQKLLTDLSKNKTLNENKANAEQILKINSDGTADLNKERPRFLDEMPKDENKKSFKDKRKELSNDLAIKFINRNAELDRISKETNNNMLKTETDRLGVARAEAQSNIGRGQTNLDGKKYNNFIDKDGKNANMSLEGIWNDANEQGITDATLRDYLIAKLNIDRHNQGIDQFNIPTYESQETINKIEKEHKDIKRVANNVWQYQKNQLQNKVDAGLISKDSQQFFEENTPHYIRIQRNVSKNGSNVMSLFNGNITMKDTIQNIKGGVDDILPLRQTMAQYEIESTNAIRKNMVLQELAKSLNYGEQSDMISLDGELNINPELIVKNNDGTYTATFFKDGNAVKIPINEGIYESLNGKTKIDWETKPVGKVWNKVVGGMSSIQRTLLTDKNPIFMITNFFKDIGDAPLNSKYGTTRFASTYTRLFGSRTVGKIGNENTPLKNAVELYGSLGGFDNTYFTNGEFTEKSKSKIGKVVDKVLSPIEKGNQFIESMPRITEFVSTIEANGYEVSETGDLIARKGSKPTKTQQEVLSEALYNAAEITTNFKRGGTWAKAANRNGATFLNASIQGFDKQIRNIKGMKNPKTALNLLTKVAMLGVAPALLNDAMYEDDEEYEDLQDYVKDQYYLFKGEDGEWIRIPKGRVMSVISGTTRRTKELSKGNKDAFKGFIKEASGQVAPNNPLESNILSPLFAVKNNKAWSGNKIVSDSIANSEHPEEEYDAKTSEIAKTIGKAFNYSPKKIDYILDQYSGGIGDVILPMTTNYAESDSDSKFGALINPLKSKFTTDSVNNNKNVSKFYEELEKAEGNKKYSKATNEDKAKYSYLYSTSLGLAELYKQQREIENDTSLSDSEKYNQSREIQKEIISQMKDAMDKVENAQLNNGTIKIGDSFYTTKNDGSFGKINNESVTKANELDIDPVIYSKATNDIYNIHDIKDSNGKTIKTRKQQVYEYINKLNLTAKQKQNLYNKYYKR